VRLGEFDQPCPAREVPLAPRRDDADVGFERVIGQLEAHLIVALACGSVSHRVGARRTRDLDLLLGDQWPGDRRAEQILPFVKRVHAEHREDVIADELLADVLDEDVLGPDAQQFRLLARGVQLLPLPEIGGEGHDLAAVLGLEPLQDHGRIEPARIGEDDFLRRFRRHGEPDVGR